jgi:predicted ATP-grasp superfamily ATP-dependent carboligase
MVKKPFKVTQAENQKGVIVLGGHIQALGIVRIMGRQGLPVIVIANTRFSLARHSRYCTGFFRVENERITDFLLDLGRKGLCGQWTIFPTDDHQVNLLSVNRDRLSEYFIISTCRREAVQKFYDKKETYMLAGKLGIPIPGTWFPGGEDDLEQGMKYPVIIKPSVMHVFYRAFRRKVFVCRNHEELLAAYRKTVSRIEPSQVIIQEIIGGGGENQFSAGVLFLNDRIVMSLTVCRLRQHPPDFGNATTYAEVADIPLLTEFADRLLRAAGFNGICEVEFKLDPSDGQYKLLEVNPRTWKWHALADRAGLPMLETFYRSLNGSTVGGDLKASPASYWHFLTDMAVVPRLLFSGRAAVIRLRKPVENAVWAGDDILPWLFEKLYLPFLVFARR